MALDPRKYNKNNYTHAIGPIVIPYTTTTSTKSINITNN